MRICFDEDPERQRNLAAPEPDAHAVLLSQPGHKARVQAPSPSSQTSCSHSEAHSLTSRDASEKADGQNLLSLLTIVMWEMPNVRYDCPT